MKNLSQIKEPEDITTKQYVDNNLSKKIDKPIIPGTQGQFAVSDGFDGIIFKTVYNAEEVTY